MPRPSAPPASEVGRPGTAAPTLILFWVGLFLLLCLLRWPVRERWFLDVDESVSALIANAWLDGGIPYRDAIDQRGPLTYLVYAAVFAVAGRGNMFAVHGALLLLVFLSCWLAARLARRVAPADRAAACGLAAATLLAVCTFTYKRSQLLAFHTEWPMMPLSLLGMLLTWRAVAARAGGSGSTAHPAHPAHPARDLLLAGLCFGAAFLAKQPAVFDGAAAGGFLLLVAALDARLLRRATLLDAAMLAGGFVAAVAVAAAYFAWHGALADFYLYFWSYNVEHYTAIVPVETRLRALDPWDHSRHYLRSNPLLFAGVVVQAVRTLVELGASRKRRAALETPGFRGRLLLVLWMLCGYFGASYSGRNFGHYFIQIIAPACLLTAGLLVDLWKSGARGEDPARPGPWTGAVRASLVWATLLALASSVHRHREDLAVLTFRRPPRVDATMQRLVETLRSTTRPGDTIFVWGYNPEIYLLADRRPASRYSNTNYLTGMLPWENHLRGVDTAEHIVPGAWEILMRELAASRPAAIVDTAPGDHRFYGKYPIAKFPLLDDFLESEYRRVERIPDRKGEPYYDVYRRRR